MKAGNLSLMVLISVVVLATTAIAEDKSPAQVASEASVEALVWPAPPLAERIRYSHEFRLPADLKIKPSWFSRVINWFSGKEAWPLVRPYTIAADEKLIVVADPGSKSVHLYNTNKKKHVRINKTKKALLISPVGVALSNSTLYVSDSKTGKLHLFNRKGDYLSSVGGFKRPTGLAYHDKLKRLYLVDTMAHKIIVLDDKGKRLFEFGKRKTTKAGFNFPSHVAIHNDRLYVNDTMNFRIQIFGLDGKFISQFGVHGNHSGQLAQPKGIGIDAGNHIYVADSIFHRVQIFNEKGQFLLDFGQQGRRPGEFWLPAGVFIHKNRIYIADSYNRRIQVFDYTYTDKQG